MRAVVLALVVASCFAGGEMGATDGEEIKGIRTLLEREGLRPVLSLAESRNTFYRARRGVRAFSREPEPEDGQERLLEA
eukprot:1614743-Alexandrium_andersonii.AAC.1